MKKLEQRELKVGINRGGYMNKTDKKYEYLLSGVLFTALVFGLLGVMGTMDSGYHLIDDHEFYRYQELISRVGLWEAIKENVAGDLAIRYRPLYIVLRTIGVAVFGTNTVLWSVCKAVEIIATLQIFYIFARKKISIFFSAIFSIMIMWGSQSEVWWRLGPQESIGMLLFSATLLSTYYLKTNHAWYNKLLFCVLLMFLSLQKESFWVSVPWFFILLFAYECNENKRNNILILIRNFLKKYFVESLIVVIVFAIDMYMILFVVGTDKIGYAGYSSDLSWKFYALQTLYNLVGECFPYLLSFIIVILISYIGYKKDLFKKSFVFQLYACIYLFFAELVIYAKSGMESRYLLPWVVSVLYIVFILGYQFWMEIPRVKVTIGGLCVLFLLLMGKDVFSEGIKFAEKGKNLQECVEFIIENTSESDKAVAVSRDKEIDYAFGVLMKEEFRYKDFDEIEVYEKELSRLGEADILFGKTGQVYYRISEEAGLSLDNYDFYETKYYEVALKR